MGIFGLTSCYDRQQNEAKKKKKTDAEIEDFFSRLMPLLDEVRFRRLCSTTATLADNMKAPKSRPFKLLKKAFLARVEKLLSMGHNLVVAAPPPDVLYFHRRQRITSARYQRVR